MKELDLQGEYVMDFFCRRDDGLQYREVKNTAVNDDLFIPSDLEEFVSENSPKAWKRLLKKFDTPKALLQALMEELKKRIMENANVAIFFNRNKNITFEGESLRLLNVSGSALSEDEEFDKNIFSAVEEVPYIFKHNGETQFSIRPDISFFLNGIFFGYAELKSNFNNQNARENGRKKVIFDYLDALKAYTVLADGNDDAQTIRRQMLRVFEKPIHITSTDINETYIIRDLSRHTDELKRGIATGNTSLIEASEEILKTFKPYPVNDEEALARKKFEEIIRALYAKKEIEKEILYYNFMQWEYVKNKKKKERKSNRSWLIAPRPKQKFGCDKILKRIDEFLEHEQQPDYYITKLRNDLEKMGAAPDFIEKVVGERAAYSNNKYVYSLLMQYAAGFGKSNIIGWTALQLKNMRRDNKWVFDKIFIVVDRLQLRDQLDSMMHNMNIDRSMFKEATDKKTFIEALSDHTQIIVVNIQKFLDLQEAIAESDTRMRDMRVVFLIDEIHRSNTGESHDEMISLFDQLQDVFDEQGKKLAQNTKTTPQKKKNIIIGFTATPSQKVLARFGEYYRGENLNQLWRPFDAYTMSEAIADGYILDPTKHIIPVPAKMYYEIPNLDLIYQSGDDEERRYGIRKELIYGNKERIEAIAQFVVNRLLSLVYGRIRGTGKAMLAVSSIPVAIEYCRIIRKLMEEKLATGRYDNYRNAPISIVYSDRQDVPSSKSMNDNVSEEKVINNFKAAKNGLIIVVDKLQTGFDEPCLHTLFLDKEIRDINAIQTISRVNRTTKYKEDCHIIDLSHNNVNVENIRDAFATYCNMVISDMEPMKVKAVIEQIYQSLTNELLYRKWFNIYKESKGNSAEEIRRKMDMEEDMRRWISDALKRKMDEKERVTANDKSDKDFDVEDDALKLKKRINHYFRLHTLVNGIIDMDSLYTDADFFDFWQRYVYIYNALLGKSRADVFSIHVQFDDQLGLVVAPETMSEEDDDEVQNEENKEDEKDGAKKNRGRKKPSPPDPLSIINTLNQIEELKAEEIEQWKQYINELFEFLKENKKLIAKINTPDHFSREELQTEFKRAAKKFTRKSNDPVKRKFLEENFELLMADFENSLQTPALNVEGTSVSAIEPVTASKEKAKEYPLPSEPPLSIAAEPQPKIKRTQTKKAMNNYQHPSPDSNVVDDLFLNSPNYFSFKQSDEPPTKENTLYLTITQHWFDEIVAGRKTVEYRQVKETTMRRYLELPKDMENGEFIVNELLPDEGHLGIFEFNHGIFAFIPKEYAYLRLGVGYRKDRDTAIIRLKGACFMPVRLPDGRIFLTSDGPEPEGTENMSPEEYLDAIYDEKGEFCDWIIGYELGEIIELSKK